MKAALIPPTGELPTFGRGDFHLLLSHLVNNKAYRDWYKEQRKKGAYLVLDNSAHEFKAGEKAEVLREQMVELNAQEVVVPDVLFDAPATTEAAIAAHEAWFESGSTVMTAFNPALMYVPQGEDLSDWCLSLRDLTRLHAYTARRNGLRRDYVIGLSKDYEVWDGGLYKIVKEHLSPLRDQEFLLGNRVHVHMLGWGRNLECLAPIARDFPWIRSTDSAKPFVYALKGIELQEDLPVPKYPGRPKTYFTRVFADHQREIAVRNVVLYKALACGGVKVDA